MPTTVYHSCELHNSLLVGHYSSYFARKKTEAQKLAQSPIAFNLEKYKNILGARDNLRLCVIEHFTEKLHKGGL